MTNLGLVIHSKPILSMTKMSCQLIFCYTKELICLLSFSRYSQSTNTKKFQLRHNVKCSYRTRQIIPHHFGHRGPHEFYRGVRMNPTHQAGYTHGPGSQATSYRDDQIIHPQNNFQLFLKIILQTYFVDTCTCIFFH